VGEDLCDQSHREQEVELGPLICLSASIQNEERKQVWGQMSLQGILNAKLRLEKVMLNRKTACVWVFF